MQTPRVQHVLFDADGVLQDTPGGWYALMEEYVGDRAREFLHYTWEHEKPALAGRIDYRPVLADDLRAFGVGASVDEVLENVWFRIETNPQSRALVETVKALGLGVYLGTNQDHHRATYMQQHLGYDSLFDSCFYSNEIGIAKPDPGFFTEITRRLGAAAASVLFIDDSERNIDGARSAGLQAAQWDLTQGHEQLARLLGDHGIAI